VIKRPARLIAIAISLVTFLITTPYAAVRTIIPSKTNSTLEAAVSAARDYDTLKIMPGTYFASNVKINKPLTLEGVGYPTITALSHGMIFIISSSDVNIRGLRFINTPVSFIKENSAILLEKVQNCKIENNQFYDNFFAIYASNSAGCEIKNNVIVGSSTNVISAGNGIHLWYCKNMAVAGNTVISHRDGIYFEFVKSSSVKDNSISENLRYGLHFMFSDSCDYENNRFVKNGAGVAVMYTRHVVMLNNEFKESWGGAAYGLLLKDIKDCRISGNRFEKNSIAIHVEGSDRILIENNLLVDNGWAIKIMANCLDNQITNNDFVNNSFQVATNSRSSRSTFSSNYWSSYKGFDLDRDGYGDVAYRPVSLYSLLVESNPPTLLLLRSFTIEALDLAERIIPTLTPETLVDSRPRMRPNL
jgi:nitrous oxidase accessory protein